MATSARPSRRAKLANVDYAVLTSGMQIPEFSSEEEASDDESWGAKRRRRPAPAAAKRRRRDTEASASSPSLSGSAGDLGSAGDSPVAAPHRRRAAKPKSCFVCRKPTGRGGVSQCDICARWFHDNCRRTDDVRSVLANTSCHDCLKEAVVTAKSALPRQQLDSIADLVAILKRAKKVLVVAGAGISVSCGIPDFRSKDGIYEMVKHMDVALPEPECLFHIDYFRQDPSPFFQLVQNVFGHSPSPSPTHRFLKLLQDKGKLLRVYSQNIDGLEAVAGVTKYLPCHGSFAWSSCMRCRARVETQSILPVIQAGVIPTCSALNCRGVLKPEITFFGEILSDDVSTSITKDRLEADLLLVMGTSLKVSPVAEIPSFVPRHIPQVVINKTPLKKKRLKTDELDPEPFDLQLLGDCDTIVKLLCDDAKWALEKKTAEPGTESSTGSKKAKKAKRDQPQLIPHRSLKRVCVGQCECAGVPDGALWANKTTADEDEEETQVDVVVCDACGDPVDDEEAGAVSYSCIDCFDYDLCAACHPRVSKSHFNGTHHFQKVRTAKPQ